MMNRRISVVRFVVGQKKRGIYQLDYIQPGERQQDAYVERYNRTVRHEWLEMNEFATIEEVQFAATQWLWIYNKGLQQISLDVKLIE